jgi:hypothetical protein
VELTLQCIVQLTSEEVEDVVAEMKARRAADAASGSSGSTVRFNVPHLSFRSPMSVILTDRSMH